MTKLSKAFLRALSCCAAFTLATPAFAAGVDELPKTIQDELYNPKMIDPQQPVGPSAYRDWSPKKGPPWTIGYASSYAGNTWRADVMDRLQTVLIPKWTKLGLIKNVVITQSNLNDSTQIQQMRQLVDQGVDAIIVCCSNPTALNQTVKVAYDKGIPVFSATGYLTSPYAVNSSANFQLGGVGYGVSMRGYVVTEHARDILFLIDGVPQNQGSNIQTNGYTDLSPLIPET